MKHEIISHQVIARTPGKFLGWPSVCYTPWGEILVVFSGDRDAHVCPFGKTQMVRSSDGGKTWSAIETINDSPLDDRDASIICTREGRLIVGWFTLDYSAGGHINELDPERREKYRAKYESVTPLDRQMWTSAGVLNQRWGRGHFVRSSDDRGKTWGPAVRTAGAAPHGPIQVADGRLIYLGNQGYERMNQTSTLVVEESVDNGMSWWAVGHVPMFTGRPGCEVSYLCEPHIAQAADGSLVGVYRHELKKPATPEVAQAETVLYFNRSTDGGKTWSKPEPSKLTGKPAHLLTLKDGRMVASYGYRFKPPGERVCVSTDHGVTWPEENIIKLREDGVTSDLGYPASTQLADGSILTVYYQIEKAGEKPVIQATHWRLLD